MTSACINSSYATNERGYAKCSIEGKEYKHHRLAYIWHYNLTLADIADKFVLHNCDNPTCINPEHLRLGTHTENMQDVRDRHSCANRVLSRPRQLSIEQVQDIRTSPLSHKELANKHAVSLRTIQCVISKEGAYTDSKLAEAI